MNFLDLLESSKKNSALLLYCLLDRIPVIISVIRNNEDDRIRDELLLDSIADCFYFRQSFKNNFIHESSINNYQDYLYALEKETLDDDVQRLFVLSIVQDLDKFVEKFLNHLTSLKGWIISCKNNDLATLTRILEVKAIPYVSIEVSKKFEINSYGFEVKQLDLKFEKICLEQIDKATIGLNITKSVIKGECQKIMPSTIQATLSEQIVDTINLVRYIKTLTIQVELSKFLSTSRRVLAALNIINLLVLNQGREIFDKKISGDRINRFMTYFEAGIPRILSFIDSNYHKNLTQYVIEGK